MDMLGFVVQKLFAMQCQMHVWKSSGYSQQRNIFVKQDVKLTEPPDAEPHVRWCERSAAKAASYSIKEWDFYLKKMEQYGLSDYISIKQKYFDEYQKSLSEEK